MCVNMRALTIVLGFAAAAVTVGAQTTSLPSVEQALKTTVQTPDIASYQMQKFLMSLIPDLRKPSSAEAWTAQAEQLRRHILDEVAFHGWPREWVESSPHFEQVGVIETENGYRIRKLRYEIVPGFLSTALLYEPDTGPQRIPAILNVLGHEPDGTSVEYEQKRCIGFAKRGMAALDLQWPGFGELAQIGNRHDYAAQLDLVGANALGFFYLAMRRGLDYLASLPEVDSARIGMTGLSGGGWQTVLLSALDTRVAASVEVAGIGSRESNLTHPHDTDEVEESAPDIMRGQDYPYLIAMRAPRPTLLVHNAVDSCCFRAPLVKPYIYDNVKPFFSLYGAPDALQWHVNFDPGTHNYQIDNREQAYQFFASQFHVPVAKAGSFSENDIKSPQELAVALPADNLTILSLARALAEKINREPVPEAPNLRHAWVVSHRELLKAVLRYEPVSTAQTLRIGNGLGMDFSYLKYRFGFTNGLSASGIRLQEHRSPPGQPAVIVLNDEGFRSCAQAVAEHVDRGEQVLALNLLFDGPAGPGFPDQTDWAMLADGSGARPLGLEVAQLVAVAQWMASQAKVSQVRLETDGVRSQVIALAAAALYPGQFSSIVSRNAMTSLGFLLDAPVPIRSAPELFCLDLYKDFDLDTMEALASPAKVTITTKKNPAGPWQLKDYAP